MFLDDKLVFLSGSTGMVGSSILQCLLQDYPTTRIRAVYHHTKPFITDKRIDYVQGDFTSQQQCQKLVDGCDCAIMAAARTSGSQVLTSQPWDQITDNLIMNVQLLEAFHAKHVNRVLYIGSASLYQDSHKKIKEEDLDLNTDPPFSYLGIGWVVRYIEKLCEFWHRQTEMEVLIARAANIFGPYAKFNPLTSNFIPAIIRKAVNHDDPFEIWGSPDVTRDVIYSEDFARAITMMMDDDSITYDTFNIGSGIKTTVGDIVKWSLQYAGHHPSKIRYNTSKPTTIRYRELDCSKIQQKFGWKPQYSIEDGVRKTLEWWVKNKEWWKK